VPAEEATDERLFGIQDEDETRGCLRSEEIMYDVVAELTRCAPVLWRYPRYPPPDLCRLVRADGNLSSAGAASDTRLYTLP